MRSPEQIAAETLPPSITDDGKVSPINRSLIFRWVERAVREARLDVMLALRRDRGRIPGIRTFPVPPVEDLLEAWEAFDSELPRSSSHSIDADVFFEAWNRYMLGHDFPCPESADGLHTVTCGSCDSCGDDNRD